MSPASAMRLPWASCWPGATALAIILALAASALGAAPARARVWHLTPGGGDAPSLQSAIDQAMDGDTLALATGIYSEQTRIVDKTLLVIGAGIERTTLNGGASQGLHGHTMQIRAIEGVNYTEVRDLTIRDGNANSTGDIDGGIYGGGVLGVAASFALVRCRIVDNSCSSLGGGVFATAVDLVPQPGARATTRSLRRHRATQPGPRDHVLLQECFLESNFGGSEGGGACFNEAFFRVVGCTFGNNFAGQAGGLAVINSVGTVSLSLFHDNEGLLDGGGLKLDTALALPPPTVRVFQNTFVENRCDRYGSGVAITSGETFEVSANVFDGQTGNAFSVLGCANGAVYAGGCNLFGTNASPAFEGCGPIDTDVFGPPAFCDADGGDYRVCTNSLAAASSGACLTVKGIGIGCTGTGCATTVRPSTWSDIKLRVR